MSRPTRTGFWHEGEWRDLQDPDALATGRQLMWLNAQGLLDLTRRPTQPLTKGEAAAAIDEARE